MSFTALTSNISVSSTHSTLDPLLGVFTGLFAYYLYENNPRTAPDERDRLLELVRWKRDKTQREESEKTASQTEGETLKQR